MKLIRKFLLFILLVVFSFSSFAFEIDSTTFDQRIDTGGYKEYKIKNNSNQTIRYKIDVTNPDSGKADMSKWIKIYPKVMNIPPLQEGILKIYAQSPKEASKGEYYFNLLIKPLVIPKVYKLDGKINGTSTISFVPVLELSGYVGDPQFLETISFNNSNITNYKNGVKFIAEISNKSFASIQLGLKFMGVNNSYLDGKWVGSIESNSDKKIEVLLKTIKNKSDIKEIILYNAETLENIKTVKISN